MDHKQLREWSSGIDQLTMAQRRDAEAVLSKGSPSSASTAAIEVAASNEHRGSHRGALDADDSRTLVRSCAVECWFTLGLFAEGTHNSLGVGR